MIKYSAPLLCLGVSVFFAFNENISAPLPLKMESAPDEKILNSPLLISRKFLNFGFVPKNHTPFLYLILKVYSNSTVQKIKSGSY